MYMFIQDVLALVQVLVANSAFVCPRSLWLDAANSVHFRFLVVGLYIPDLG